MEWVLGIGEDYHGEVGPRHPFPRGAVVGQPLQVLLPLDENEAPVLEVTPALGEARRLENLAFDLRRDRSGAKFAYVELRGDGFVGVQESSRPLAMTGIRTRSDVRADI